MTGTSAAEKPGRGAKLMKVLEASAKALNLRGVSQTSLAEIADDLGISRAALYYYFDDQQDLVFQCYQHSCERMAESLEQAKGHSTNAMHRIEQFVDLVLSDDAPECAALSDVAFLRPEQQSRIVKRFEAVRTDIASILEQGASKKQVRKCRSGVVAASIIGLVSWVPMARRLPSHVLSQDDLLEALKSLLRVGIAADRRAPISYLAFQLSPVSFPATRVFDADLIAEARKEAVTAAASWLFNLKGVDATSLEEIALGLGVTKKVIYHNVGDKETLVAECYRRSFRIYEEIAERMAAYQGPGIEAICASAHALAEASLREDITPLATVGGLDALPEKAKGEIQKSSERLLKTYLRVYGKGQADGSVRNVQSRAVMNINPGSFEWLPKWFESFQPEELAAAPSEVAQLLRLGLMPL